MKRHGTEWTRDGDGWSGTVIAAPRFHPRTWRFGGIWQCVVEIDDPACREPRGVHVCLQHRSTMPAAMAHCVEWVRAYQVSGPSSVEETLHQAFDRWPSLYRTRMDVADHILCTIGNGFSWLDGAALNTGPEDHLDRRLEVISPALAALFAALPDIAAEHEASARRRAEEEALPRPFVDDGGPRAFCPISDYSLISTVPDDVRPDWLAFAYETACAVRDRHDDAAPYGPTINRRLAAEIAAKLIDRLTLP